MGDLIKIKAWKKKRCGLRGKLYNLKKKILDSLDELGSYTRKNVNKNKSK